MQVTREQVLRYRWRVQELDREPGTAAAADLAVLDIGLQNGAQHAGRLSFVDRGVSVTESIAVTDGFADEIALVWGVRGTPHHYRREDLTDVATAVSPFDAADAYKRLAGTGGTWKKAGIDPLDALSELGTAMRDSLEEPMSKGDLSSHLHGTLPPEYEVDCRPCKATHPAEMAFRMAPLFAGIELEPGTSPPVLRRIPGWPGRRRRGPADDPQAVPDHLRIIRAYLHFLGPATPADVAAYLETTAATVKKHLPKDVVEVDRAGTTALVLADDVTALEAVGSPGEETVRLLSPYDLFTAAKDRALLVEKSRHKELWPVLGRPGAVAVDGEIVGTWRPTTKGTRLSLRIDSWTDTGRHRRPLEARGELLAATRGKTFAGLETP